MSEHAHQVEPLIGVSAATEILGMGEWWVKNEAANGRIPSYKIGGRRKFRASELEAWLRDQAEGPKMAPVHRLDDRRR